MGSDGQILKPPSADQGAYRSTRGGVIGLFVALLALLWSSVAVYLHNDRQQSLDRARDDATQISLTVAEHISGIMSSIDRILLHIKQDYESAPGNYNAAMKLREIPLLRGLLIQTFLVGPDGFLIATSGAPVTERIYLGDRETIRMHAASDNEGLRISAPGIGAVSGRWSVFATRRLNSADGSYGGTVGIAFDPEYFSNFFSSLNIGEHGLVAIVGTDMIIRAGTGLGSGSRVGRTLQASTLSREIKKSPKGTYEAETILDHVARIVGYRTLDDYSLISVVGLARDDVLAEFQKKFVWAVALSIAISAFLLSVTALLVSRIGMLRDLTIEFANANGRFEKIMQTSPVAFISIDMDQRVLT